MSGVRRLQVGGLPGRKRKGLFVEEGCEIRVLAYFQSEEAMQEFLSFEPRYLEDDPCTHCGGSGSAHRLLLDSHLGPCPYCKGTGREPRPTT